MRKSPRVTTRNFLKMESESFQDVSLRNGVPKGTNSPFFDGFTSNQIQLISRPKSAFCLSKKTVFEVDTKRHEWTCILGIGLRKSYDLTLKSPGSGAAGFTFVSDSLSSAHFFSSFKKDIKTNSRHRGGDNGENSFD